MKHIVLSSAIAAATLSGPAWAEQYVCEVEQAAGFVYSTIIRDQWRLTSFNDEIRFLIESNGDTATARVFGNSDVSYDCDPFTDDVHDYWSCSPNPSFNVHLWFNIDLLRFTFTNIIGYTNGDDVAVPNIIGIGTCADLGS